MIGTTLGDIRDHIEALASEGGEYSLVCSRYGDRPVPATGLQFESRPTARAAAQATEQYRAALRRYDPQLPYYDVIVCQDRRRHGVVDQTGQRSSDTDADDCSRSEPVLEKEGLGPERRELVEFCHRIVATVFEMLSQGEYDTVETAVMDTYLELAETVSDPDDLCLCLLESMAVELDTRLDPSEQRNVLSGAAARLPTPPADEELIEATLTHLHGLGVLGSYTRSPWSTALDDGTRSVVVHVSEYAFSPRNGRLPVLPIVLDLYRRPLDWPPSAVYVVDAGESWRIRLVLAHEAEPERLASVPIQPGEP
jgi:hypothetical protein